MTEKVILSAGFSSPNANATSVRAQFTTLLTGTSQRCSVLVTGMMTMRAHALESVLFLW